jgi:hypothetical protein
LKRNIKCSKIVASPQDGQGLHQQHDVCIDGSVFVGVPAGLVLPHEVFCQLHLYDEEEEDSDVFVVFVSNIQQ